MFMGCPGPSFDYPFEALGGVRVISSYMKTAQERLSLGSRVVSVDRIEKLSSYESAEFITVDMAAAGSQESFSSML